ncbi:MAG: extracellular solute-binding protein [Spirochaetaceae bacterium]|nr:MAG: extracellular solute-binding protein [Spirochaetaceae bacterium]
MSNRVIRVLAVAICLLFTSTIAFAAGTQQAAQTDRVSIKITVPGSPGTENLGDRVYQAVEDRFNVHLDIIYFIWNERTESIRRMIAAGDVPDVFENPGTGSVVYSEYRAEGLLADITDRIPTDTGIKRYFNDPQHAWMAEDGRWYGYPRWSNGLTNHVIHVRQDWLDALGMDLPDTVDDFYTMLVAFRDRNPGNVRNILPLALESLFFVERMSMWFTGILPQTGGHSFGPVGNTYEAYYVAPGYRDFLVFTRRLITEGLLDPDWPLGTHWGSAEKIVGGRAGSTVFNFTASYLEQIWGGVKETEPTARMAMVVPPIQGPGGQFHYGRPDSLGMNVFHANSPRLDRAIEVFDWLLTDQGQMLWRYGVEGVHYTVGSDGKPVLNLQEIEVDGSPRLLGKSDEWHPLSRITGYFFQEAAPSDEPYYGDFYDAIEALRPYRLIDSALGFSHPDARDLRTRIEEVRVEHVMSFLLGETAINDANWNRYLDALNRAGYPRLKALVLAHIQGR